MMGLAKVFQQCRPVDRAGQPQVAPVALQHMKVLADLQEIAAVSSAGGAASSVIEDLLEASRNGLPTVAGKAEHLQLRGLVAGSGRRGCRAGTGRALSALRSALPASRSSC